MKTSNCSVRGEEELIKEQVVEEKNKWEETEDGEIKMTKYSLSIKAEK